MTRDILSAVLSTMGKNRGHEYPPSLIDKAVACDGGQDKVLAILIQQAMEYERGSR